MRVSAPVAVRPLQQFKAASPKEGLEIYLPPELEIPPEPETPEFRYEPPAAGLLIFGGMAGGGVLGWTAAVRKGWVGACMGGACGLAFAPTVVTLTASYLNPNLPLGQKPTLSPLLKTAITVGSVAAGAALGWVGGGPIEEAPIRSFATIVPLTSTAAAGAGISPTLLWCDWNDRRYDRQMREYEQAVADRKAALERQKEREVALAEMRAVKEVGMDYELDSVVVGDFEVPRG